jgi:hypothetical protein
MKKIIFLLIASVFMSQTFAQTITLRPPTVGSTSATINGQVSGVVSSATAFSVIYGESATNLNKTKKTNVTFGPGVLLLSGFTLGTDLDSLKQLTKYYYKYAVNDAFTGVVNRLTVLDSFTTTKIPFVFSLETSNLNDTAKKNSFVSKLTSNDVTKPVYKIVNNAGSVDGNLFAIKNDSLFASATLDTISKLTYSFSIQATFSDATTKSNNITINVVDKTPPIIRLKSDSLLLFLNSSATALATVKNFDTLTSDNRKVLTTSLSKSSFFCENLGLNKVQFIATDSSGNIATKDIFITIRDTIKPILYINNSITLALDSNGLATINSSMIEKKDTVVLLPSLNTNLAAHYTFSGNATNLANPSVATTVNGAQLSEDRFGAKNESYSFNGTSDFISTSTSIMPLGSTARSFSIWVNFNKPSLLQDKVYNDWTALIGYGNNTSSCGAMNLLIDGNNTAYAQATSVNGNSCTFVKSDTVLQNGVWQHISFVFGDSLRVYINGKLKGKSTSIAQNNYNTIDNGIFYIGRMLNLVVPAQKYFLNGKLDDIRVYKKALTADEIKNLYEYEKLNPLSRANTTYDNCSIDQTAFSKFKFDCADLGKQSIKYSVIDKSKNQTDTTISVTLIDTLKPIMKVKNSIIKIDNSATYKLLFSDFDDGSSDNCGITSRVLSKTDFTLKDTGVQKILYTISDKSGNSISKEVSVSFTCKSPSITSDTLINVCQGASTNTPTINAPNGATLLWYANPTATSSSTTAPVFSTSTITNYEYYVSNLTNGCESRKAKIMVQINPVPTKPIISKDTSGSLVSSIIYGNKWYKDNTLLSDTTQKYKPTSQGNYQSRVFLNTCSVISDAYYYLLTDIIKLSSTEFINVYPNPYVNKVNIDYNLKAYKTLNLDIIDFSTGVKILTKNAIYTGTPLYLGQLSGGVYIIRIYSNDNKISYQFKMIKM